MRIFKWLVGLVSTMVIIIAGGGYLWVKSTVPSYNGEIKAGVEKPVRILRDGFGVPHILAESEDDAFFGLGYAMAQDRLWQMDMIRRAGRGRLAEILGPDFVEIDKIFLALSVFQPPESIFDRSPDVLKNKVEIFAAGVNHFMTKNPLPLEFRVLGYRPEPWQAADAEAANLIFAWDLNSAWSVDLVAAAVADRLGPDKVEELFPDYHPEYPTIVPPGGFSSRAGLDFLKTALKAREFFGFGLAPGSNNWVLSGQKTTTGKPILANDPHLGFAQPPIWWEGVVIGGDLAVGGVFCPGIPVALIGHTRHHAWGVTNIMADDADFFIERLNPDNPDEYLADGEWRPVEKVTRTIKVKGGDPVEQVYRLTRNGLLIDGLEPPAPLGGRVLAMRWVGQDHTGELESFYGMAKAANWEEFNQDGVRHFSCPGQNFVYADVDGNIGWRLAMKIPKRRGGYDPLLPAEGHTGAYGWDGYLPFEAQPFLFNPEEGFIATANNKTIGPEYPHYISKYWAGPERVDRIRQLIGAKEKLSLDDVKAMQMDVRSLTAEQVVPLLLKAFEGQEAAGAEKEALALLSAWDCGMETESPAAAVFEATYVELIRETIKDELGDLLEPYLANSFIAGRAIRIMLDENSVFFDDLATPEKEDRQAILRRALSRGLAVLAEKVKTEGAGLPRWGDVHTIEFKHGFSGKSKLLDRLLNLGPYPVSGGMFTVNPTQHTLQGRGDYATKAGASMRQVIDLADVENSARVITTGVSGHFMSRHYGDQARLWLDGGYHPVSLAPENIEKMAAYRLTLIPVDLK